MNSTLKLLQEKDKYQARSKEYKECLQDILLSFYCVGGPLNDNVLKFSMKQQHYLMKITKLIRNCL